MSWSTHVSSTAHRWAPTFVWMFQLQAGGKRWAVVARNNQAYFAFTAYCNSKPFVSMGMWGDDGTSAQKD